MDILFAIFVLLNGGLIIGMHFYIQHLRDQRKRTNDVLHDAIQDLGLLNSSPLTYAHQIEEMKDDLIDIKLRLLAHKKALNGSPSVFASWDRWMAS
jgi:hypothetical protein